MRRKDREVKDPDGIFDIVERCNVVHLGMVDNGKPYVVALNFGYEREGDALVLYLHCAMEGRKIDILHGNPDVYFQMDCVNEFIKGTSERPCSYCWRYDSVMGSGQVEFVEDVQEKEHALNRLIQHIGKTTETFSFPPASFARTCVLRIRSNDITGKHHE